jgi:hypothetical protein
VIGINLVPDILDKYLPNVEDPEKELDEHIAEVEILKEELSIIFPGFNRRPPTISF